MDHSENTRNVLIVSYLFPPISGIGAQRPLKFTKYLHEFGWQPTVLTVKNGYSVTKDVSLQQELPENVKIHRAKDPLSVFQHRICRSGDPKKITAPKSSAAPSLLKKILKKGFSALYKALKAMKNSILIPDEHIFWVKPAIRLGKKAIAQQKVHAIYSTSGPNSSHLVGYLLKKKTGLPWIADFRDPWTQNMHQQKSLIRSGIEHFMERLVMQNADIVLTVTHSFAKGFRQKYGNDIQRLEVIHNGFDRSEFDSLEPIRKNEKFTLVYTGILYEKRSPRMFLQGLKMALDRGDIPDHDIIVRFAGVFDYPGRKENAELVEQLGLSNVVHLDGYLSHQDSVSLMKGADLLLLIGDVDSNAGQYIPGKLFEYLGARRPIFSLTVPGEVSGIIEKFKLGTVADPTDPVEIADCLSRYYKIFSQSRSLPSIDWDHGLNLYDRKEQTRSLALLLDELVALTGLK